MLGPDYYPPLVLVGLRLGVGEGLGLGNQIAISTRGIIIWQGVKNGHITGCKKSPQLLVNSLWCNVFYLYTAASKHIHLLRGADPRHKQKQYFSSAVNNHIQNKCFCLHYICMSAKWLNVLYVYCVYLSCIYSINTHTHTVHI